MAKNWRLWAKWGGSCDLGFDAAGFSGAAPPVRLDEGLSAGLAGPALDDLSTGTSIEHCRSESDVTIHASSSVLEIGRSGRHGLPAAASCPGRARRNRGMSSFIYADDLGYGDVGCYGATKVATPNVDDWPARASGSTNAHSASATCTPSRYAMLTGEYAWRRKGTGVLPGRCPADHRAGANHPGVADAEGRVQDRRGRQVAPRAGGGRTRLERGDPAGTARYRLRLLLPDPGDGRPRALRVRGEPPGRRPRPERSHPGQLSESPSATSRPAKTTRSCSKMHPSHGHDQTIVNGISRIGYMSRRQGGPLGG